MRAILRAKRRSNQQIIDDLQIVYPRAEIATYTDLVDETRVWTAGFELPHGGYSSTNQEKLENLERWLNKYYPYIRGKKK